MNQVIMNKTIFINNLNFTDVSIPIGPFSMLINKLKNITGNYARCLQIKI